MEVINDHVVQTHLPFAVKRHSKSQSSLFALVIYPEPPHSQWVAKLKDRARETAASEPSDSPEFQGFPEFSLQ